MFFSILFLSSCQTRFDKAKWNIQTDRVFPPDYRNGMINDLTKNYKLVGLKYSQLIQLLGTPDGRDGNRIYYNIDLKYAFLSPDPNYSKNLWFMYSKDSIITSFKVEVWNK